MGGRLDALLGGVSLGMVGWSSVQHTVSKSRVKPILAGVEFCLHIPTTLTLTYEYGFESLMGFGHPPLKME